MESTFERVLDNDIAAGSRRKEDSKSVVNDERLCARVKFPPVQAVVEVMLDARDSKSQDLFYNRLEGCRLYARKGRTMANCVGSHPNKPPSPTRPGSI
jgi:hypothetical protein